MTLVRPSHRASLPHRTRGAWSQDGVPLEPIFYFKARLYFPMQRAPSLFPGLVQSSSLDPFRTENHALGVHTQGLEGQPRGTVCNDLDRAWHGGWGSHVHSDKPSLYSTEINVGRGGGQAPGCRPEGLVLLVLVFPNVEP